MLLLLALIGGRTVESRSMAVTVALPFRYAGTQRFVLGGTAEAEQHLFVVADREGKVQELLWIQFEEYLPTVSGTYDYSADATVKRQGLTFFTNARRYTAPPQPGSDRDRAFALLARKGYRADGLRSRARLVYLSSPRSEVMVIYAVSGAVSDAGMIERAFAKVAFEKR